MSQARPRLSPRHCSALGVAVGVAAVALGALGAALGPPQLVATAVAAPLAAQATLAQRAVSPDRAVADAAIATLRAQGPAGLDALTTAHRAQLARWFPEPPAGAAAGERAAWARLRRALDRVAGQYDAHASRLFWHTDLAAARAAAQASGKPIVSLRLLGRLDEALSCANSRFFRTALYAHPEVARDLREQFVLHWSSERPVPVVTIDFGDGRRLRRTVTGNSAHHVLDPAGRLADTIPGLWAPAPFRAELAAARRIALATSQKARAPRRADLVRYHQTAYAALLRARETATRTAAPARPAPPLTVARPPRAEVAGELAASKAMVQMPILRAIGEAPPAAGRLPGDSLARLTAAASPGRLHPASIALMREHLPPGGDSPRALAAVVASFERGLATDTARNRFELRPQVHQAWLRTTPDTDLDAWNTLLYRDVFLTPRSDPWLGLLLPDTYTGLPAAGVL